MSNQINAIESKKSLDKNTFLPFGKFHKIHSQMAAVVIAFYIAKYCIDHQIVCYVFVAAFLIVATLTPLIISQIH